MAGRRAVLVGGSSGIGLATAKLLREEGAEVTIVGSRGVERALRSLPAGCEGHAVDVRDEERVARLFAELGEFDHLAYTAGEPPQATPLATVESRSARERIEIRFWGAFTIVKHAHPRIRPGGSIVLTSGTMGARPLPGRAIGAASCAAPTQSCARCLLRSSQ